MLFQTRVRDQFPEEEIAEEILGNGRVECRKSRAKNIPGGSNKGAGTVTTKEPQGGQDGGQREQSRRNWMD